MAVLNPLIADAVIAALRVYAVEVRARCSTMIAADHLPRWPSINPQSQTIFFYNPQDPLKSDPSVAVSDVFHYTYSTDANGDGHLDGYLISDATGSLSVADLRS